MPHLNYIHSYLVSELVHQFPQCTLEAYEVTRSVGLDGFMSAIFKINIKMKTENGFIHERNFIAKLMKGDVNFREKSKSYIQFGNEIFFYSNVLPRFEKMINESGVTQPLILDLVPKPYIARFGFIEGLSEAPNNYDSILVLENLSVHGYKLGPRVYLNREHLIKMSSLIGQYHALSYGLKWRQKSIWDNLMGGIKPLVFINETDPDDSKNNFYRILYRLAFDRFYDYFDRLLQSNYFANIEDGQNQIDCIKRLRQKYFDEPTRLLERYRTQISKNENDERFAVILHGDYNRNNVMFLYNRHRGDGDGEDINEVDDIKMIDFQELRYSTPVIDLSFFMYINTSDEMREDIWTEILTEYHGKMIDTFSRLLKGGKTNAAELKQLDGIIEKYRFEEFYKHFSRYAFYGVLICMHFLPWILSNENDCAALAKQFETNMHGEEFRRLSLEIGGDEVNRKILNVIQHACKMGYMNFI